jgi:hypothetical protein
LGGWPWPLDGVQGWFESLWNTIVSWFRDISSAVWQAAQSAFSWISSKLDAVWSWISSSLSSLSSTIWQAAQSAFSTLDSKLNAISSWILTRIGDLWNQIWGALTWLRDQISSLIAGIPQALAQLQRAIADAIAAAITNIPGLVEGFLAQLATSISQFFEPLLNSIHSALNSVYNALSQGLNSLYNGLRDALNSLSNALGQGLNSLYERLNSALSQAGSVISNALGSLGGMIMSALTHARDAIAAIPGQVKELLDPVLSPIAQAIKDAFQGLFDAIKKAFQDAATFITEKVGKPIGEAIANFFTWLKDMVTQAIEALTRILGVSGPVTPENALEHAIGVALPAFIANFAIYVSATTLDLLHPIKGTGIVPTGVEVVKALGPQILVSSLAETYTHVTIKRPLEYYWNSIARTFRPIGPELDQMLFEEKISEDTWRQIYRYHGWPEDLIEAWHETMFIEPSDRILIDMFSFPVVPQEWIGRKLKERGYKPEDVNVIMAYAQAKALERARASREGIVITRYREGFITQDQAIMELQALGFRPEQIKKILAAAALALDTDVRKDRIEALRIAFRRDIITEDELRQALSELIVDPSRIDLIVATEIARKTPIARRRA